jgi:vancomycin permeability regulator SanA
MVDLELLQDEANELLIQYYGKRVEIAVASMSDHDANYFMLAGDRDNWRMAMEERIKARSPAQVMRMEQARGLAG